MNQTPIEKADWILIRLYIATEDYIPSYLFHLVDNDYLRIWFYLRDKYDHQQLADAFAAIRKEAGAEDAYDPDITRQYALYGYPPVWQNIGNPKVPTIYNTLCMGT